MAARLRVVLDGKSQFVRELHFVEGGNLVADESIADVVAVRSRAALR